MHLDPATIPVSSQVWDQKYRFKDAGGDAVDRTVEDTWRRVARAAAAAETGANRERWAERFHEAVSDYGLLPAGRIVAGAGTGRAVTLFNCFVMGRIEDDLASIFDNVKEAALTMQQGGGIGHDFSTLRPRGALVNSIAADASGPVSFMDVWDAMCRTIMSAGSRRGAMMGTLRCDHPDIEDFIAAKSDPGRLRNFNVSVLVTDAFMAAVREGASWPLIFAGRVYREVDARALWDRLMRATYDYAEPGVIFIDRVNAGNNLAYCESITATNPCGEQPLPAYGACLLGSINLARLVERPFEATAAIDVAKLEERVRTAVRMLDNIVDVSGYPLSPQRNEAHAKRRLGLGVTGLADALVFHGARYDSAPALALAEGWMATIERAAYLASAELAAEKGAFPLYERDRFLDSPNVRRLESSVRREITRHGMRNGCLTSIAPTGTISLFAGNVSSGIEPIFDLTYRRRMLQASGGVQEIVVEDYAHAVFRTRFGRDAPLPDAFVTAGSLSPRAHLEMQSALQRHVDSSISKTVNCPAGISFEAFKSVYLEAYGLDLKGCTTFRPNAVTGSVLSSEARENQAAPAGDLAVRLAPGLLAAGGRAPMPALSQAGTVGEASGEIVYMARPLERDPELEGVTYKLRWPGSDHALYITINDIVRAGRRRPFEIFINSKNLQHYAWTVALTRMISAVFRRGGDVTFICDELKAIFDPQGGHWMNGRYVPSLIAAIGDVIEAHMIKTGFLRGQEHRDIEESLVSRTVASEEIAAGSHRAGSDQNSARQSCPRCGSPALVRQEGCWLCRDCGFSRCS